MVHIHLLVGIESSMIILFDLADWYPTIMITITTGIIIIAALAKKKQFENEEKLKQQSKNKSDNKNKSD